MSPCVSEILNSSVLQTLVTLSIGIGALYIGVVQNKINKRLQENSDFVEIFAFNDLKTIANIISNTVIVQQFVKIQNIGAKPICIKKYIFNGITSDRGEEIVAPTSINSNAHFYIDLPDHNTPRVQLDFYYTDHLNNHWKNRIEAFLEDGIWKVKTFKKNLVVS